jgi:hypothetical protein
MRYDTIPLSSSQHMHDRSNNALTGSDLFEFFQLIEVFLQTLRERESAEVHYFPSVIRGKFRAHGLMEDFQHYGLQQKIAVSISFIGGLESKESRDASDRTSRCSLLIFFSSRDRPFLDMMGGCVLNEACKQAG